VDASRRPPVARAPRRHALAWLFLPETKPEKYID